MEEDARNCGCCRRSYVLRYGAFSADFCTFGDPWAWIPLAESGRIRGVWGNVFLEYPRFLVHVCRFLLCAYPLVYRGVSWHGLLTGSRNSCQTGGMCMSINEWTNEWMYVYVDQRMNEWKNERLSGWMNERFNRCLNEYTTDQSIDLWILREIQGPPSFLTDFSGLEQVHSEKVLKWGGNGLITTGRDQEKWAAHSWGGIYIYSCRAKLSK